MHKRPCSLAVFALILLALSAADGRAQQVPAQPVPAQERTISVTFYNAALEDVVAGLAAFSGRTIVMKSDVGNPPISAELRNVEWRRALTEILEKHGLSAQDLPSGIILVEKRVPPPVPPVRR
jgi:hypothetical protein